MQPSRHSGNALGREALFIPREGFPSLETLYFVNYSLSVDVCNNPNSLLDTFRIPFRIPLSVDVGTAI